MNTPKGGRGKKAPYETTVRRVPNPVLGKVDRLIDDYRDGHLTDEEIDLETAIDHAKKILLSKKSAKVSLTKIIALIYGKNEKEINL